MTTHPELLKAVLQAHIIVLEAELETLRGSLNDYVRPDSQPGIVSRIGVLEGTVDRLKRKHGDIDTLDKPSTPDSAEPERPADVFPQLAACRCGGEPHLYDRLSDDGTLCGYRIQCSGCRFELIESLECCQPGKEGKAMLESKRVLEIRWNLWASNKVI